MSNNCDDPNIIPPNGTAKQVKGKAGSRNRKPLPSTTNTTPATNVTVSDESPVVAGGKVKASSTPPGAVQPAAQVKSQT